MKRFFTFHPIEFVVYTVLIALAIFAVTSARSAEPAIEERVIDLPKDGDKWFVSVIGDVNDAQFRGIVKWFDDDTKLADFRKQVHYWKVNIDSSVYRERYKHNVIGTPTIRVQKPSGSVIWEGVGKDIPGTPEGLYSEIAGASTNAIFPLLPWRRGTPYLPVLPLDRDRPVLPWRQDMENKCGPDGCPAPVPPSPDMDYLPPPLDDGGAPKLEPQGVPAGLAVFALMLCTLCGAGAGIVSQWKKISTVE